MEGNSYHLILFKFFQKSSLELCSLARKMEEIPWHLKQTGSFKELHGFLSDPAYDNCNLSLIRKSFANAVGIVFSVRYMKLIVHISVNTDAYHTDILCVYIYISHISIFFIVPWSFCQAT